MAKKKKKVDKKEKKKLSLTEKIEAEMEKGVEDTKEMIKKETDISGFD